MKILFVYYGIVGRLVNEVQKAPYSPRFLFALIISLTSCSHYYNAVDKAGDTYKFESLKDHNTGDTVTLVSTGIYYREAMYQDHQQPDTVKWGKLSSGEEYFIEYRNVVIQ